MRKIGTLESEADAHVFVDYLATQNLGAQVRQGAGGCAVWIVEERDVERATAALEEFRANPGADLYRRAGDEVRRRRAATQASEKARKNRDRAGTRTWAARGENYLTFALMALCIVITLGVDFGKALADSPSVWSNSQPIWWLLAVDAHTRFPEAILQGQIWRLLTPIFVHWSWAHLIFNLYALQHLGSMIEMRRGWRYFGGLVLAIALISNVAQGFVQEYHGGISGVVYGLFGFVWMRMRYQGNEGYYLERSYVLIMMGWFVFCFLGLINIANAAHAFGLATGVVLGAGPFWWQRWKRSLRQKP
ncbi:MAG: rhomboid family intramembrane serine protease [Planctomycetota bacterium]